MMSGDTNDLDVSQLARALDTVFPRQNRAAEREDYGSLLAELRQSGIASVDQLRSALAEPLVHKALAQEARQLLRRDTEPDYAERVHAIDSISMRRGVDFTHVGLARIALGLSRAVVVGRIPKLKKKSR